VGLEDGGERGGDGEVELGDEPCVDGGRALDLVESLLGLVGGEVSGEGIEGEAVARGDLAQGEVSRGEVGDDRGRVHAGNVR
jgi:hypothetical protein